MVSIERLYHGAMKTMNRRLRIRNKEDLAAGLDSLCEVDDRFIHALNAVPEVPLRLRPQGFESLVSILVHQQVSLASAAAIWQRVEAGITPFEPHAVIALSDDDLRGMGLSRPKVRYIRALAEAIDGGLLNLPELEHADEPDARAWLTAIVGIGDWTADIYLLQCLGHPDIWPAKDIGLQAAVQSLFELKNRPTPDELIELAAPWRPWRAVAARLLWSYYREMKDLPKAT